LILQWLPKALANRDAQIAYIAQDNPLAAITQGDLIKTQVDQLIEQPGLGRIGRKRGTRELVISKTPFVVIFRVKAKRIEIIRLLHSSQQYPRIVTHPTKDVGDTHHGKSGGIGIPTT